MISPGAFVEAAVSHGFRLWTGVPCSTLQPLIDFVEGDASLRYVGAANEGDAVAIASGSSLGGLPSVAMMQNSGLGNAVSPLTSLNAVFEIPVLLIVTLRGDPSGAPDEPQHALMGARTTDFLELAGVSWRWFPASDHEVATSLKEATETMSATKRPFAFVMRRGDVAPHSSTHGPSRHANGAHALAPLASPGERPTRAALLRAVLAATDTRDVVVATTGYTGRELYAQEDRENHFYMVGSMGCASSFGLGLALACPRKRVVVLDGDGAALMRLGAFATVGYERPSNLVHVLFDNEMHESTGGQSTVSHSVDFASIAAACGYPNVVRCTGAPELEAVLAARDACLAFLHCKILPGAPDTLPRPLIAPRDVAVRLAASLEVT
jgi:phosphonopyruvate decarboxylase